MRTNFQKYCSLVSFVAAAVFGGCEKKPFLVQVHGKVLLDGQPLATGGVITSLDTGRGAQGSINNGEFQLSTFGVNDGALIGTHRIAVVAYEQRPGAGPEAPPGKLLVPQRYTNPETSDLTIEVKAGEVNSPTLKLISK
jgi:hypothetical protein